MHDAFLLLLCIIFASFHGQAQTTVPIAFHLKDLERKGTNIFERLRERVFFVECRQANHTFFGTAYIS